MITMIKDQGLRVAGLIFLFLLIFSANTTGAQTNSELLLTWEAQNYAPPEYIGKRLATPGSVIAVSAELVAGGKLQDARRSDFSWYVDGALFRKGAGAKEISFPAKKSYGNEYLVRAITKSEGKSVEGTLRIPVSRPEVIIQHAYPNNIIPGGEARLRAQPYFFAVSSPDLLRVAWSLQDVLQNTLSGIQDFVFDSSARRGQEVRVSARITNPSRITEWREGVVKLNVR